MTDEIRECYRLLELEAGAPRDAVKVAYRELIKIWHPDRFPNDPKFLKRATEKTKALNEAFQKINSYHAGTYTESRASTRAAYEQTKRTREACEAKDREEAARRAREAAEAREREEAARQAREAAEAKAREEARIAELRRRAQEWADRQTQDSAGAFYRGPVPPVVPPTVGGPAKRTAKKRAGWRQYAWGVFFVVGPALSVFLIAVALQIRSRPDELKQTKARAEKGDASAQRSLGQLYENGSHVEKDDAGAAKWYERAAEQGDRFAQTQLGYMYSIGKGVPQDYEEAAMWSFKAAAQGDATAQNNIGTMCQNGQGVERDYTEAYKWYLLSAAQGNFQAASNRDNFFPHLSVDQVSDAQTRARLGFIPDSYTQWLHEGRQTSPDQIQALRASAERGDAGAQTRLGSIYYNGQGVTPSWEEAFNWYSAAALQGETTAQNNLGVLYQFLPVTVMLRNGRPLRGDVVEAYKWYCISAAGGNTNAMANRDALLRSMAPKQAAEGQRRASEFRVTKQPATK
jgi:TPR repeat protein